MRHWSTSLKASQLIKAHHEAKSLFTSFHDARTAARGEYAYFHLIGDVARRDKIANEIAHLDGAVREYEAKVLRLLAELQPEDAAELLEQAQAAETPERTARSGAPVTADPPRPVSLPIQANIPDWFTR